MFVKVCGITSEADALLAVAMGADAVGFIFAPSARQIAPQRAGDIAKRLPPEVLTVGVFRNHSPKRVVEIVNRHGLSAAQLHGDESTEDTAYVAERVPRTMKVFVAGGPKLARADEWGTNPILVDAPKLASGEPAHTGAGPPYDYALARQAPTGLAVVLAGGLAPNTVADAIRIARPWGVDVAGGVEREPGVKDPKLVAAFVQAAKGVVLAPEPTPSPTPAVTAPAAPMPPTLYDWEADSAG